MPIPLLAIPIAAGFAASGGGVSIGTLVGSIFGGVAGGAALGGGYWWYSRNTLLLIPLVPPLIDSLYKACSVPF